MRYFRLFLLLPFTSFFFSAAAQDSISDLESIRELVMLSDYDQAWRMINQAIDQDSGNYELWYYKGIVDRQILKPKESIASFRKALELSPGNSQVYHQLSAGYLDLQEYKLCIAFADSLLYGYPDNRMAKIRKAQALQKADEHVEAIVMFSELYQIDSANGYIMRQLGSLYSRLDSVDQAINWYRKAIQLDSMDLPAWQNIGSLLVRSEQYEAGVDELNRGLGLFPTDPWLFRFRGSLHIMGAKFSEAENDFSQAIVCGDSTAFVYRHLGLSMFKQSKYQEALPVYEKTTRLDPEDPQAWFYLGYCYKWQTEIDQALVCMEKSLSLSVSESISSVYGGLAEFHALKRDYEQAIHHYSRAWEYDQTNPVPLAQIGMLIEQSGGEKTTARTYYKSFMEKAGPKEMHLLNYVSERINIINEKLFMEGKLER